MFILRIDKVLKDHFDVVSIWVDNVDCLETWIAVPLFLDIVDT